MYGSVIVDTSFDCSCLRLKKFVRSLICHCYAGLVALTGLHRCVVCLYECGCVSLVVSTNVQFKFHFI